MAARFDPSHELLVPGDSAGGRIALLPWDAEIFGFPVADYEPGERRPGNDLRATLERWARENRVELVSCHVPAEEPRWFETLTGAGFQLVDFRLRVSLPKFQSAVLPEARLALRPAEPGDLAAIEEIAATAFRHGRYHADPRFPARLASLRFRRWMRNAFAALESGGAPDRVYVLGKPGEAKGFFHAAVAGEVADLRLGAVDLSLQPGIAGFNLYVGTLHALKAEGARTATAVVSVANVSVLNIYTRLGFSLAKPEAVFHWHAAEAPHLET